MRKSRQFIIITVFLLSIVVMLTLATQYPPVQWRISVLKLKLSGDLPPNITWRSLYSGMTPYLQWNDGKKSLQSGLYSLVSDEPLIYRGFEIESNGTCSISYDTPIGSLKTSCYDFGLLELLIFEQLEKKIYDHDSARIKHGDVVIDVGAHIGTFSRFALSRGAQLVVAFEPDPTSIIYFKQNLEKEIRSKNVILIEAAAWDSPGNLEFKIYEEWSGKNRVSDNGTLVVPAVTIDNTIKTLKLDHIDFIKMDIEGAERNAVAGASKTISRFRPRMALATYHLPDDPEVISSLVFNAYPDYKMLSNGMITYFFDPKRVSSTKNNKLKIKMLL